MIRIIALSSLLAWGLAQAGDCPQAGGRILLKTEPARAEVWVDGEKLADESPLVTPTLCPGTHEVKVKAEGYAVQTLAVEVPGNAMVTKTIVLDVARTPGSTFRDPLADGIKGPEMVVIGAGGFLMGSPAGGFLMGSPASEPERDTDEGPQHQVVIAEPFAIGKYEVTFEEYDRFARATGRALPGDQGWGRGRRPVIAVSWDDATAYAQWLSVQSGRDYRLPSEAEWEYAARAGTLTPFWTGDCIHTSQANYNGDYDYNGCGAKTGVDRGKTLPVGSLQANPWGLYDTAGNVDEWTEDCWNEDYQGAPTAGGAWRHGNCQRRVVRGGSWFDFPRCLRSAYRDRIDTGYRNVNLGFRVARTFTP